MKYLVEFNPTEAQWGGLARDLIMFMRMYPSSRHSGFYLKEHLQDDLGMELPQWFLDEVDLESKHVIPKGTMATLVYKAMVSQGELHEELHLNNPDSLPPVDTPLLIQVDGVMKKATRTGYISSKAADMEYVLEDGSKIEGRYKWTYS